MLPSLGVFLVRYMQLKYVTEHPIGWVIYICSLFAPRISLIRMRWVQMYIGGPAAISKALAGMTVTHMSEDHAALHCIAPECHVWPCHFAV